jgi:hypothetical protein
MMSEQNKKAAREFDYSSLNDPLLVEVLNDLADLNVDEASEAALHEAAKRIAHYQQESAGSPSQEPVAAIADVQSHYEVWRRLLEAARDKAISHGDLADEYYWNHELNALARILAAPSTGAGDAKSRISGEVTMNLIAAMTDNCPREDCSITQGLGTVTCMGWTPSYDKSGKRTDRGDPNTTTTAYRCTQCGNQWLVSTQYGVSTVTEVERPQ